MEWRTFDDRKRGSDGSPIHVSRHVVVLFVMNREVPFFGTSMSAFQQEPVGDKSDWDVQVARKRAGLSSLLSDAALAGKLPAFLPHKDAYIRRSEQLGNTMFRISIDFPRLCPEVGVFDESLMDEYVQTLARLKMSGHEPLVTLQHFTMPQAFVQMDGVGRLRKGAWEHPDILPHVRFYVDEITRYLADKTKIKSALTRLHLDPAREQQLLDEGLVRYFMTMNEPIVTLTQGYAYGKFPPFHKGDACGLIQVLDTMVESHRIMAQELKHGLQDQPGGLMVGASHFWQSYDGVFADIVHRFEEFLTKRFEDAGPTTDFICEHYYFRTCTTPFLADKTHGRVWSDHPNFGDIYPAGILPRLTRMHELYPDKPIFVDEFGFSDARDVRRPYWILETVRHIFEAKKSGVPVGGVLVWSLVDNFEWDQGMTQKFGFFEEQELFEDLVPSREGIRSWEVWRAIIDAVTHPGTRTQETLDRCYTTARRQYENAIDP